MKKILFVLLAVIFISSFSSAQNEVIRKQHFDSTITNLNLHSLSQVDSNAYMNELNSLFQSKGSFIIPSDTLALLNYLTFLINNDTTALAAYLLNKIYLGGGGTVSSITFSSPLTGGTISTNGTAGITQAGSSLNGYLSSIDWNTFNSKQTAGTYLIPSDSTALSNFLLNKLAGYQPLGTYTIPGDTTALANYVLAKENADTTALAVYLLAKMAGLSGGSGTVTGITAGTGLTGGTISTIGTIAVDTTFVSTKSNVSNNYLSKAKVITTGSYTNTNLTVDSTGRITSASNGSCGSGNTIVGNMYPTDWTFDYLGGNAVAATRYYCAYTTTVTKMYLGVYSSSTNTHLALAIYASLNPTTTGDRPNGSPIASTSGVTMTANIDQPYILSLSTSVILTAGNYYWFAWISDLSFYPYVFPNSNRATGCQWWAQTYSSGFPSISSVGSATYAQMMAALP